MKEEQKTEQIILDAAEIEFLDKGFALAKTTEIAARAGVNHALLHYYFRTKENLFEKVFELKVRELSESLQVIIGKDSPFMDRVKGGIEAHFDFIASNPKLPHFIFNELIQNPRRLEKCKPMIAPVLAAIYNTMKIGIAKSVKEGIIRDIDPMHLMYDIVSMNVVVFVMQPVIGEVIEVEGKQYADFLKQRKAENVETILSRLRV
ncbi:MAG: TetR/AcrR family transcriptional regulator [Bacteroidales bacterium]|nr:TetR/AcrR family transcriptional regulator [Bacteroidales bacterium]MDD4821476.1 TetR/AcrR family transcriptional regulator [Bacteroidales bacterium]